ncbi:MAG: response regulator [Candidatus Korobacteraceae bacterium]
MSVDDEPTIRFSHEKLLEAAGYDVVSAADGEKALRMLAALPIDLVLLDFSMPGMDGEVVAREVKRRKPEVHVILITGLAVPKEALAFVDSFMQKGDGPEVLLRKIKQLLLPSQRLA